LVIALQHARGKVVASTGASVVAMTCVLVVTGPVVTVGSHIGALYVGLKHSVEELDIESPLQLVNFVTHDLMSGALVPKNESTIEPMPIAI
tara:strand:+ start:273 stop:545 length:273 start_codon:yes stop_codon:yes gene_type:complete